MEPAIPIKTSPLEEQFNDQVGLYHEMLNMTAEKNTDHTRKVIKDTYKELKQFVKEHPEFADKLPAKYDIKEYKGGFLAPVKSFFSQKGAEKK